MREFLRYSGQALFFIVVAALTGYFSSRPVYHQVAPDMAQIKMSLAHAAGRAVECRRLTASEIAALPANERRPNTCSRERVTARVQLEVDGLVVHDELLPPTGLSRDGPARTYAKFLVPVGDHLITARLRDGRREDGFDYETSRTVHLEPWQNLAIDFRADSGDFEFR
jgi:hypothetical protein